MNWRDAYTLVSAVVTGLLVGAVICLLLGESVASVLGVALFLVLLPAAVVAVGMTYDKIRERKR